MKITELSKANPFSSPFNGSKPESSRKIAFASTEPASGGVVFGSAEYYALCAFGGALSCGLTHTAVVPLDLVKCRIQVDKAKYQNISTGFKVSIAEEGARGLAKGWAPTLIGYSIQGLGKFGFYEAFKNFYGGLIGEVTTRISNKTFFLLYNF